MDDPGYISNVSTVISDAGDDGLPVLDTAQCVPSLNDDSQGVVNNGLPTTDIETAEDKDRNSDLSPNNSISELQPATEEKAEVDAQHDGDDGDDSDFGSFDDAEIEESLPITQASTSDGSPSFNKLVMSDVESFTATLKIALEGWGAGYAPADASKREILSDRAQEIYRELSAIPHLKPSNWTRSKLRRDLLLRLGVPIDLDELAAGHPQSTDFSVESKVLDSYNIDWEGLLIPSLGQLNIDDKERTQYMTNTSKILEQITTDNLSNVSRQFLQEQIDDEGLKCKLDQFTSNFKTLVSLASVWSQRLDELKKDHETFEAVVQNTTGYKQKLKREELRDQLKRRGTKKNSRLW